MIFREVFGFERELFGFLSSKQKHVSVFGLFSMERYPKENDWFVSDCCDLTARKKRTKKLGPNFFEKLSKLCIFSHSFSLIILLQQSKKSILS